MGWYKGKNYKNKDEKTKIVLTNIILKIENSKNTKEVKFSLVLEL